MSAAHNDIVGARPFVTVWRDKTGTHVNAAREMDFAEIERVLRAAPTKGTKEELPLLKLARFGIVKTPKGALRHDENVAAVFGVEGDYDGEAIPMQHAAETLSAAGVEAILYTSSSHTPKRPRWRVIAPLSYALEGDTQALRKQHRHWTGVLNALLSGVLTGESFVLSQCYFFGNVTNKPPAEIIRLSGCCLDQLEEIPEPEFPKEEAPGANGAGPHAGASLEGLSTGEHIYNNTRDYAARLIAKGLTPEESLDLLRGGFQELLAR